MGVDSDSKLDRRAFLHLSARALSLALASRFLGGTKVLASPSIVPEVLQTNLISPEKTDENASIEQLLVKFEELTLAEKTELLWSEDEITIPMEHISHIVSEIHSMPTVVFAALGDSTMETAHFNLFDPQMWKDSLKVNFGEQTTDLQEVISRFKIIVDSSHQPFGPLIGATLQALDYEPIFCNDNELCLPNESITDSIIRQEPKVVFICAGRNGMSEMGVSEDFNDFAKELENLCQKLLNAGIIPVVMNFPIIQEIDGRIYPDLNSIPRDQSNYDWDGFPKRIEEELTIYTPFDAWISFYAQKRKIPHLNPLRTLSLLPNYGLNIDQGPDIDHFSSNFQDDGLHYNYDRTITEWSGSEMINYLLAKFLKQLISQR